ncbi:HERC6 [Symbiodinium necroappetens]|uniref:HERC6 protein n=1 Tax=Symbiodinium necroappetens TaxID=1628268 RepID=A0A812QYD1_9DINO|nr:HERC6 [Symbiodinium necroappetens]
MFPGQTGTYQRNEALLEERGHRAAIRVENDTWKTRLSPEQQSHMADYWKQLRYKCYDYWMNEVENENLMQAHGILKEAVSRCTRDFREKTNHVKAVAVCHEEVLSAFEHCRKSRQNKE